MRIVIIAFVALALGVLAGFLRTKYDQWTIPDRFADRDITVATKASAERVKQADRSEANLSVDDAELQDYGYLYNFGSMDRDATNKRTFVFRNEGQKPLTLELIETTCKCTTPSLAEGEVMTVEPGGTGEVSLEWKPEDYATIFRQSAIFKTNDPRWSATDFTLSIEGRVQHTIALTTSRVTFTDAPVDEARSFALQVHGLKKGNPIQLLAHKLLNAESKDDFEIDIQPLTAAELEEANQADRANDIKSGLRVTISTKPGLQMGPIQQVLRLETNLQDQPIDIPIEGNVQGDIYIRQASNFKPARSVLVLGLSKPGETSKATLQVFAKGPHKDAVKLVVEQIDPSESLKVTVGEAVDLGTAKIIPLTIEVKPDSPEIVRLGPTKEQHGKVVLKTSHPNRKELVVYVEFAVGQ